MTTPYTHVVMIYKKLLLIQRITPANYLYGLKAKTWLDYLETNWLRLNIEENKAPANGQVKPPWVELDSKYRSANMLKQYVQE